MIEKLKKSKKGFTLMEMLIVVAIIAILVAIAIPTFTGAVGKANQATDDANYRACKALIASTYLLQQAGETTASSGGVTITTGSTYYITPDGTLTATAASGIPSKVTSSNTIGYTVTIAANGELSYAAA